MQCKVGCNEPKYNHCLYNRLIITTLQQSTLHIFRDLETYEMANHFVWSFLPHVIYPEKFSSGGKESTSDLYNDMLNIDTQLFTLMTKLLYYSKFDIQALSAFK